MTGSLDYLVLFGYRWPLRKGSPGGFLAILCQPVFSGLDCWKQELSLGKTSNPFVKLPIGISGNLSSPLFPGYHPIVPYVGLCYIGSY